VNRERLLDESTILEAFNRLAARLQGRRVVADFYLLGGGEMVFAFDERQATQDLDARFTSTSAAIAEVRALADELGLPSWWLNEQGTAYLPTSYDPYPLPVFDHPNLRVMRASDRHLLAMKAAASRRNTKDLDDLRALAGRLGLTTADDVVRVHDEVFPDDSLTADKIEVIREAMSPGGRASKTASGPAGTCRVCGRRLRSAASVAAGVGPICATRGPSR
jgi:hypothetical protein